jgi:integrase
MIEHSFTEAQWHFLCEHCDRLPQAARQHRMRFILRMAYGTGMRLFELAAARAGDLIEKNGRWFLRVEGKGEVEREVPMPSTLMIELREYLAYRGLPEELAQLDPDVRLIGQLEPDGSCAADSFAGVTPGALAKALKMFFRSAAARLRETDPAGALRLASASTHWLRHTHGSHAIQRGVKLVSLQKGMGHASIDTTSIYVDIEERLQHEEMERFYEEATA